MIVSLTRAGSTLLQRMLSTHRELVIWGEHFGILSRLRNAVDVLDDARNQLTAGYRARDLLVGSGEDTSTIPPQVNPFDIRGFEEHLRRFIVELFTEDLAPGTRWGFKEVHYFTTDLRFLQRLFPDMRLIVLVRRPAAQVSSFVRAPWRQLPEPGDAARRDAIAAMVAAETATWAARYGELMRFVESRASTSMVVRYEDLEDPSWNTDALFAHCGLDPAPAAAIASVRSKRVFSSDTSEGWPVEERAALDAMIAAAPVATDHDRVVDYYYPEDSQCS